MGNVCDYMSSEIKVSAVHACNTSCTHQDEIHNAGSSSSSLYSNPPSTGLGQFRHALFEIWEVTYVVRVAIACNVTRFRFVQYIHSVQPG